LMFYIMLWKTIALILMQVFVQVELGGIFVFISFSWRGEYFLWAWRWYQVTLHSLGTKHSNIESIRVVYSHSSNNLFCSSQDGIDTRKNNSFIQFLYIQTNRNSALCQYVSRMTLGIIFHLNISLMFAYNMLHWHFWKEWKYFSGFTSEYNFFRFLRRKYSARCCCFHTSNARYLDYGTSNTKALFSSLHFWTNILDIFPQIAYSAIVLTIRMGGFVMVLSFY